MGVGIEGGAHELRWAAAAAAAHMYALVAPLEHQHTEERERERENGGGVMFIKARENKRGGVYCTGWQICIGTAARSSSLSLSIYGKKEASILCIII